METVIIESEGLYRSIKEAKNGKQYYELDENFATKGDTLILIEDLKRKTITTTYKVTGVGVEYEGVERVYLKETNRTKEIK